jgi:hypothetical protein
MPGTGVERTGLTRNLPRTAGNEAAPGRVD